MSKVGRCACAASSHTPASRAATTSIDTLRVAAVARGGERPTVSTEHLFAVASAVRAREVLRFDYAPRSDGSRSEEKGTGEKGTEASRRVEPHHVVTWGGRWYLVGWDLDRNDWRTFPVDRMTPWSPTGRRFTPRDLPGPDVGAFIAERFAAAPLPCRG